MSGSEDVVSSYGVNAVPEHEIDDVLKSDTGNDLKEDADSIICTVTVQSSSTWSHRSVTIPS